MLTDKTVLIVEDNAFLALDLSSVVEELEGRVAGPVATAREALQLVGSHEIIGAVINCDLVDVDVAQVVMQLAEKDIPVVILTTVGPPPVVIDILPTAPVLIEPVHPRAVLGRLIEEITKRTGNEENDNGRQE